MNFNVVQDKLNVYELVFMCSYLVEKTNCATQRVVFFEYIDTPVMPNGRRQRRRDGKSNLRFQTFSWVFLEVINFSELPPLKRIGKQ